MKKLLLFTVIATIFNFSFVEAQFLKEAKDLLKADRAGISQEEAGEGVKEALVKGINQAVEDVTKADGYFKNPQIKIPFPTDAQKVEAKLRNIGLGDKVDELILSLNRAAEDAAAEAKPIFVEAIKNLSIKDALNVVTGEQDAATQYFQKNTTQSLTEKFQPIISSSLDKVDATKHWENIMTSYNKIPLTQKVNPDLEAYVTEKAIAGLFLMVAKEEQAIRNNPSARTSAILKKVFSN